MAYIIFKNGHPINSYLDIPHKVLGINPYVPVSQEQLAALGCYTFLDSDCPSFDCNLYYQKENWEIQGFNCVRTWTLCPQDEIESWRYIRDTRNKLLAETDWTQLPDNALSEVDKNLWAEYRMILRDITSNFSTPQDVVWPVKP